LSKQGTTVKKRSTQPGKWKPTAQRNRAGGSFPEPLWAEEVIGSLTMKEIEAADTKYPKWVVGGSG